MLELVDEFTEIVPSAYGPFIGHHQGLFANVKIVFKKFFKFLLHILVHWPSGYSVYIWPERLGFNPWSSHTKDSKKWYLDASLLNTQHYKIWIKSKVEHSRKRSSALLLHLSVVAIEKGALESPLTYFYFINIISHSDQRVLDSHLMTHFKFYSYSPLTIGRKLYLTYLHIYIYIYIYIYIKLFSLHI